jgi:hypothetical protein
LIATPFFFNSKNLLFGIMPKAQVFRSMSEYVNHYIFITCRVIKASPLVSP